MNRFIGVISDTHGLLRPEALTALAGSSLIVHAGDIGSPHVLDRLRGIAPVRAVRGNNDEDAWGRSLPLVEYVEFEGVHLQLVHERRHLSAHPPREHTRIVVLGHSHKPASEEHAGRLYFNPGSAGPRRFNLPISVGRLWLEGARVRPELVTLHLAGAR